jgi:hypothetical protein
MQPGVALTLLCIYLSPLRTLLSEGAEHAATSTLPARGTVWLLVDWVLLCQHACGCAVDSSTECRLWTALVLVRAHRGFCGACNPAWQAAKERARACAQASVALATRLGKQLRNLVLRVNS